MKRSISSSPKIWGVFSRDCEILSLVLEPRPVFRHTSNALMAILLLWMLAFNLLQLFIYRRLKRDRRPHDSTDTIRHIVEVMLRNVATLPEPIPWAALLNTS